MRIAITGATGFVGSHVLDALLDQKEHDVQVFALVRNRNSLHRSDPRLLAVVGDMHLESKDHYGNLGKPDILIHLAWAGLPNYDQLFHFENELPKQYTFLKNLVEAGLSRLLVTGTCFEYGVVNGELTTDKKDLNPANPYALAKHTLHQQLQFLQDKHPFILNWARLFYMFGERQRHGSLYSALKKAVENGEKSFAMSSGEQLRDYLPVQQVARKIVEFALQPNAEPTRNICSGQPISVRRMAEMWCENNRWNIHLKLGAKAQSSHEAMAFWGRV